jgi:hypothetical protein
MIKLFTAFRMVFPRMKVPIRHFMVIAVVPHAIPKVMILRSRHSVSLSVEQY